MKDGGISFINSHERYLVCKIVNLAHLLTSEMREILQEDMKLVAKIKQIIIEE
jgi:hypothetical protein